MRPHPLILGLLTAILLVAVYGVYSYRQELNRRAQARCVENNKHSDAVEIRRVCYGIQATPEEVAKRDQERREIDCELTLNQYGSHSAVTKQHCAGTELGKKIWD